MKLKKTNVLLIIVMILCFTRIQPSLAVYEINHTINNNNTVRVGDVVDIAISIELDAIYKEAGMFLFVQESALEYTLNGINQPDVYCNEVPEYGFYEQITFTIGPFEKNDLVIYRIFVEFYWGSLTEIEDHDNHGMYESDPVGFAVEVSFLPYIIIGSVLTVVIISSTITLLIIKRRKKHRINKEITGLMENKKV